MTECNKDEAIKAKDIAEKKMQNKDFEGALRIAETAQKLFPELENINQLLTVCNVHCAAEKNMVGSEKDFYGILQLDKFADEVAIKKQYRKLAFILHPDKNKLPGAEAAFKLVGEANVLLLDPGKKAVYDVKCQVSVRTAHARPPPYQYSSLNRRKATSKPSVLQETFWTACHLCKTKFQYLKKYVNHVLLCQICKKSFTAYDLSIQFHTPNMRKPQPKPMPPGKAASQNVSDSQPCTQGVSVSQPHSQGIPSTSNRARGYQTPVFPPKDGPHPSSPSRDLENTAATHTRLQGCDNTKTVSSEFGMTGGAAHDEKVKSENNDDSNLNSVAGPRCERTSAPKKETEPAGTGNNGRKRGRKHAVESSESSDTSSSKDTLESSEHSDISSCQDTVESSECCDTSSSKDTDEDTFKEDCATYSAHPNSGVDGAPSTRRSFRHRQIVVDNENGSDDDDTQRPSKRPSKNESSGDNVVIEAAVSKNDAEPFSTSAINTNTNVNSEGNGYSEKNFSDGISQMENGSDDDDIQRPSKRPSKNMSSGNNVVIEATVSKNDAEPSSTSAINTNTNVNSEGNWMSTPKKETESGTGNNGRKRGRKHAVESSESSDTSSSKDTLEPSECCDTSSSKDTDEDAFKEDCATYTAHPNSGVDGAPSTRRSFRHRQIVVDNENGSDDDDTQRPSKRPSKNKSSGDSVVKEAAVSEIDAEPSSTSAINTNANVNSEGNGYSEKSFSDGISQMETFTMGHVPDVIEILDDFDADPEPDDTADPTVYYIRDPEFSDFDKEKEEHCFAVDQFWALYDPIDGMPRYYAQIKKIFKPGFKVQIIWLEGDPEDDGDKFWLNEELPFGCGRFQYGDCKITSDLFSFSHEVHFVKDKNSTSLYIRPRKGEIWALIKDWNINWNLDPENHRKYKYEIVEVVSDFSEDVGIRVTYLDKVRGFVCLFQRASSSKSDFLLIPPDQMLRFSHSIPSYKMSGTEREGVPVGSFELDTASLPEDPNDICYPLKVISDKENLQKGINWLDKKSENDVLPGDYVDGDGKTVTSSIADFLRRSPRGVKMNERK